MAAMKLSPLEAAMTLLLLLPLEMATKLEVEKDMFVLKKMVSACNSLQRLKRDLRGSTLRCAAYPSFRTKLWEL